MKLEASEATARTVWARLRRYVVATFFTVYTLCVTLAAQMLAVTRKSGHWVLSTGSSVTSYLVDLREAERTRRLMRHLSRGLVGIRHEFSASAVVAAPILALVTEWWVVNSHGYRRIHSWVIGTWTGANPQLLVFFGVAVLMALSVAFTVFNSGYIPATLLVMGPIFGIGFTRYGLTFEHYGTVGVPEATAFAGFVAVVFGVPIGAAGFLIGTMLRKVITHLGRNRDPDDVSPRT